MLEENDVLEAFEELQTAPRIYGAPLIFISMKCGKDVYQIRYNTVSRKERFSEIKVNITQRKSFISL